MAKATGIFADIIADLNRGSKSGNVQYLKDGDTTIKLLMPEGRTDMRGFYEAYQSKFKGEFFPYYLVTGVITEADEDEVADATKIRYIKVTKSILLEIVNLLQKKWKLLDDNGPVIVITKGKKSGKISYTVAAVPDSFDAAGLEFPEQSITEAAAAQEAQSIEMDEKNNDIPF